MYRTLAAVILARPWRTLALSAAFLAVSLAMVVRGGKLTGPSFGDNEAEETERLLEQVLGHSMATTVVVIFHSDTLYPGDDAFRVRMNAALAPLLGADDPDVLSVMTPNDAPPALAPGMVNGSAKSAIALVSLRGTLEEAL